MCLTWTVHYSLIESDILSYTQECNPHTDSYKQSLQKK